MNHLLAPADLPIYVINLDSRPDRWRFQQTQARLHRIPIHRFPAMDGQAGRRRFPLAAISDGAAGLWLTFDCLVKHLAGEGVAAAVVLEDDAVLAFGFLQRAARAHREASGDVAMIQLAFLSESSWRPQNSVAKNIRKILRLRSRFRALTTRLGHRDQADSLSLGAGTHALLIFPDRLMRFLPELRPESRDGLPLDTAFVMASRRHPEAFVRVERSLAFQLPVRSDIAWAHRK